MKTPFILITRTKNETNIKLNGSSEDLTSLLEEAIDKNTDFGDAFFKLILRELKRQERSRKERTIIKQIAL